MDKFETLAAQSSLAVAILGNADITDIEMLPVQPRGMSAEEVHKRSVEWADRRLHFIGIAGIVDGKPRTALAVELDDKRIAALSQAFIAYFEVLLRDQLEQPEKGDEVTWLRALYALPDSRQS